MACDQSVLVTTVGEQGPPGFGLVWQRFDFEQMLEWRVAHNRNSLLFYERLVDNNGDRFLAPVHVVDPNTFVVQLTEATTGYCDVAFAL